MKIKLKRLTLLNFKGIRSLDIRFQHITNIFGENATGKTTIEDAFCWLFFGKDSTGRSDSNFEIKTLDSNNEPFHRMDHEVTGEIEVDGREIVMKRVYKENWVKKRGESETVFSGHTTSFYWNDVPLKLEEFQAKISGILPENLFKLITNNSHFSSLKWQDRRGVLLDIGGEITNEDVMESLSAKITKANRHQWDNLVANLNADKSLDEFQKQISGKKKKFKDELALFPARIDEAKRSLPDEVDYQEIDRQISSLSVDLKRIDDQLMDKTTAQKDHQKKVSDLLSEIQGCRNEKQQIEFNERNAGKDRKSSREGAVLDVRRMIRIKEDDQLRNQSDLSRAQTSKISLERDQASLRERYKEVDAEKLHFAAGEFACPTCKRDFEQSAVEEKKEELTKNFNASKSKRLSDIREKGKSLGAEVAEFNTRIAEYEATAKRLTEGIADLKHQLTTLEEDHNRLTQGESLQVERAIASNPRYLELNKKISSLEEQVNAPLPEDNKSALLREKGSLTHSIDSLKQQLSSRDQRGKTLARIDELEKNEREMGASLADLEGVEFAILQFTRAKMDLLESRINGRFKVVKFKLFAEQINGGEVPCCETLIKGVPYADANTASRINAGLDIINTLCAHYNAFAPIFVDNAESVNTLIPVDAQLIRLVVSKDKKLKIESPKGELFEQEAN